MKYNPCPLCRRAMRLWALDARFRVTTDEMRKVCIRAAKGFRDECCCTDREKYLALVEKLKALPLKTNWLSLAIWFEVERIKNCNGGHIPSGRTFNAWVPKVGLPPSTINSQPSTAEVAA